MAAYAPPLQKLIEYFVSLPGVGPKTAERYVFYITTQDPRWLEEFGHLLASAAGLIKQCQQCYTYSDVNPCGLCSNSQRDQKMVCVVAKPQDIQAIERSRLYRGLYFVLGGTINALEGIGPDQLRVSQLLGLVKDKAVTEVILALNPDLSGEATSIYLQKILKQTPITVTRLARGLPMNAELEYMDDVTLQNALEHRISLS